MVGLAAGIAQLLSAPWPLAIRIAVFSLLALAALLIAAYQLGLRRGHPAAAAAVRKRRSPAIDRWSQETLTGTQVVKVASKSKNVAICELREDGSLGEQWLPQAPHQAFSLEESRSGHWSYGDEGLRIVVRGHHLLLRPNLTGTWAGFEQYGPEPEPFVGAVVDPDPFVSDAPWAGLKIGEHGARRIITADPNGRLTETDPFNAGEEWEGRWSVVADRLHIDVGNRWSLAAKRWNPGILLGVEHSDQGELGYAVVKALEGPRS